MNSRRATFASTSIAGAVLLVACGGSSNENSSNSSKEFCDQIVALEASAATEGGNEFDDEAIAQLRSLRDVAPDEIGADLDVLIDLFQQIADVDPDDVASAEQVFELLLDPRVTEAGENVESYGVRECGIESESSDDDADLGSAGSTVATSRGDW